MVKCFLGVSILLGALSGSAEGVLDLTSSKTSCLTVPDYSGVTGMHDKTLMLKAKGYKLWKSLFCYGERKEGKYSFVLGVDKDGSIKYNNGFAKSDSKIVGKVVNPDKWTSFAFVSKGSLIQLYVDGEKIIEREYNSTVESGRPVQLGHGFMVKSSCMGLFDDVSLWDVALSDNQIVKLGEKLLSDENGDGFLDQDTSLYWKNLMLYLNFNETHEDLSSYKRKVTLKDGACLTQSEDTNDKSDANLLEKKQLKINSSKKKNKKNKQSVKKFTVKKEVGFKLHLSCKNGKIEWSIDREEQVKLYKIIDSETQVVITTVEPLGADCYSLDLDKSKSVELVVERKDGQTMTFIP